MVDRPILRFEKGEFWGQIVESSRRGCFICRSIFGQFEWKKGLKSLVNRIKLLLIAKLSVLKRVNLRSFVENARERVFPGQIEFIQSRYMNEIFIHMYINIYKYIYKCMYICIYIYILVYFTNYERKSVFAIITVCIQFSICTRL